MKQRMFDAVKPQLHPVAAWLYGVLAIIMVPVFLELGMLVADLTIGRGLFALPSDLLQRMMFTVDPIFTHLLLFIGPSLLLVLWVWGVERRSPVGLGFFKQSALLELLKGWLIGGILMGLVVALLLVTGSIRFIRADFSVANWMNFLVIIPFWILQSGTEELLTRGWLFPVVSRNTRLWIGVLVSSSLFALMHLGNPSVSFIPLLNIGLFGLLACLYLLKTDNIWGISTMHAAWNCFQGNFFGLQVSGLSPAYSFMQFETKNVPTYLSGGGFGPEGSIFSSIVMLAYIAYLAYSLRKKHVSVN